jgi:Holliday junction resolvasome RuvABC endonuclease subunit
MTRIIGIDPGAKACGWAVWIDGKVVRCGVLGLAAKKDEDEADRWHKFGRHLDALLAGGCDLLAYELVVKHFAAGAAQVYGGFKALILERARRADVDPLGINLMTVKKRATGHGDADKTRMLEAARFQWPGLEIEKHDAADACWIAETAAWLRGWA